jgi:hypothetical protein
MIASPLKIRVNVGMPIRNVSLSYLTAAPTRPIFSTRYHSVLNVPDVLAYFCFSADESRLAMALPGKTVGIYDFASAREIAELATDVNPFLLAFDPAGRRLYLTRPRVRRRRILET